MNAKTANEYLRMVEKFFDWCKGRYSVMQGRNVFEGSALRVAKSKTGEKPRDRFDLEELKRIFANPFYGEHADTDWKYWTPLVQLYTGARSNSLLKLKVGDIRTEDGITFLDINAEEYSNASIKRTDKTAAGLRRIPLHPDLVELGFLKFVVSQKGKELLFEGLRVSKRGKFTKSYGDWFRRHLEKLGLKRKGRDTHSFRHTWDHFAEASRIESEWRDRLQGHARHGMRRVYGGKTELKLLDEEMRKLRFRGLNLSHLKR
jgi:integrase